MDCRKEIIFCSTEAAHIGDTLNVKDRRQRLLVNTYYLPPRAPHLYMSLVDNAATVKSQTHPWTHLLVSLLGHSC